MTTYDTRNPLGSQDPRDLFDNAKNLDRAANSLADEEWIDRFGKPRKTWRGIEKDAELDIAQAVSIATAEAADYRDQAHDARDDAKAAASAASPIKFYDTHAKALADNANIPVDGLIEVSRDETHAGARTRYFKSAGGVLMFAVNLDQIRLDLAKAGGAAMVGYGDSNIEQALAAQSKAVGVASSGAVVGSVQGALDASLRSTRLRAILDLRQRDATVLLQGDSTGNEDWEFFYLTAIKLCAAYPSHSVYYRSWNPDTKAWGNVQLQVGTSGRAIRMYNGSVPGASAIYWQGGNKAQAYDGWKFDLILVNYGLNTADTDQTASACACLYNLRYDQPEAEILMMLQPPDYTNASMLARSQARSDAQRRVAAAYGVAVVDAFSLFAGLVNATGNVGDWYIDKIHPNAAGQQRWADIVFPGMLNTSSRQRPRASAPTQFPNGNFTRWPNGTNASPLWWGASSSALRDTVRFESQGQAARCMGGGAGTEIFRIPATELIKRWVHLPEIVIAARVWSVGGSNKPGRLYLAHSASTAFTDIRGNDNGYLGVGSGAFRWAFLVVPKSFYEGRSDFQLGIFAGEVGELVTVDRIVISGDLMPPDSDGSDGFVYEASFDDAAFNVAANSVAVRAVSRPFAVLGADIQVRCLPLPASVIVSATAGASNTEIRFANISAVAAAVPAQAYTIRIS